VVVTSQSIIKAVDDLAGKRLPTGDLEDMAGVVTLDEWSRDTPYVLDSSSWLVRRFDLPAPVGRLASLEDVAASVIAGIGKPFTGASITEVGLRDGVGIRVRITTTSLLTTRFRLITTPRSIWSELGFEGDPEAAITFIGAGVYAFDFITDKPRPIVRIPVGARRPIWYRQRGSLQFVASPGIEDAYGGFRGPMFRLGDIVAGLGALTSGLSLRYRGVVLTDFSPLGSIIEEEIRIEHSYDGDYPALVQGYGFDRMEWPRAIGYLLSAGVRKSGEFESGPWLNCAGSLFDEYLDADSFADAAEGAEQVTVAVFEPRSIREIIEPILVTYQHQIVIRDGRLTLIEVPLGIVSEDPVVELTHADINTAAGVDWEIPTDLIVASVRAENLGYNHADGQGRTTRTLVQGAQLATWPAAQPLTVDMASQPSLSEGSEALSRLADDVWPRWGGPFLVLRLEVNSGWGWLLRVGDPVSVSHTLLPDPVTVGRGIDALPGWVYRTAKRWRGRARARITILVPAIDGSQMTGWAPAARSTAVAGAQITCEAHRYRWASGDADAAAFEAGDLVYVYPLNSYTAGVSREVLSVVGNAITLTAAVGVAHPVEIEYRPYSSCTDSQKRLAFMGTGSPPSIGGDPPYHYG